MNLYEEFSVDSGILLIADLEFLQRFGFKHNNSRGLGLVLSNSHPYFYESVSIWKEKPTVGNVRCSGRLVFIGDPCYHFEQEKWQDLLSYTNSFLDESDYYQCFETSGDGVYEVEISDIPL